MLEIAHHIPGRIRLRVRDNAVAVGLMARLEALAGIRRILRRRYSVIIEYDPMRLPADALTAACALPAGTACMGPANARPGAALSGAIADAVLQHLVERLLFSLVAALL